MKLDLSGQIFEKYSKTKFKGNPINESRVVPCGRADTGGRTDGRTDGQTDMTKQTEAFRNFVNASKDIDKACVTGKLYVIGSLVFQIRHFNLYN
jgi:hypothetical protein